MKLISIYQIYRLLICVLVLASTNGFSQSDVEDPAPTDFVVIRPVSNDFLNQQDTSTANKTMLRVATKQQQYHLTLVQDVNFEKAKLKITSMELYIEPVGVLYSINAKLVNLNDGKEVVNLKRGPFRKNHLQREIQKILEQLFVDVEDVREESEPELKPIIKKVTAKQTRPDDSGLKAFQQRILDLKKLLMDKFNSLKKEKEEEEEESDEEKEEDKNNQNAEAKETQIKKKIAEKDDLEPEIKEKMEEFNFLGLGYWVHDVNANYIIDTNTYVPLINITYNRGFFFDKKKNFFHIYGIKYGSLLDQYEIEIEPSMNIMAGVGATHYPWNITGEFHLAYHTMSFGTLDSSGAGIVAAHETHIWADLLLAFRPYIFGKHVKFSTYFGTMISGENDFNNIDPQSVTGTRLGFELLIFKIWKYVSVSTGMFTMDVSMDAVTPYERGPGDFVTGMTLSATSFDFNLVYTF